MINELLGVIAIQQKNFHEDGLDELVLTGWQGIEGDLDDYALSLFFELCHSNLTDLTVSNMKDLSDRNRKAIANNVADVFTSCSNI